MYCSRLSGLTVERRWSEGKRNFCRVKTMLVNQHGETLLEGFQLYAVFEKKAGTA